LRLTADGKLRNCLFSLDELDLKTPLRRGDSAEEIADLVRKSVSSKWAGHQINQPMFVRPPRTMHTIGG
jgi:cyclic pyranopterin phosphate synthase